jgi:hypothetical protein
LREIVDRPRIAMPVPEPARPLPMCDHTSGARVDQVPDIADSDRSISCAALMDETALPMDRCCVPTVVPVTTTASSCTVASAISRRRSVVPARTVCVTGWNLMR